MDYPGQIFGGRIEAVERRHFIDNCWLADKWSPSITPKGVYRCEVMGSMDMALNLNLGLNLSLNWWARPLSHFETQIDAFCNLCGVCLNLPAREDTDETDDVTLSNVGNYLHRKNRKQCIHESHSFNCKIGEDSQPYRYIERMKE